MTGAVLFDDCDYSDAQELLYNAEPYTGLVIERGPDGQLVSEQHFRHGILDGRARLWSHAGVLLEESDYNFGRRRWLREWHRNGQRKRHIVFDDWSHTSSDEAWDESGRAIDPRTLY